MSGRDDERPFRPKPGRSRKERAPQSFIGQVRGLTARAPGASVSLGGRRRYNGSARGAAMVGARALSGRWVAARPGARRVVVKARVVKLANAGAGPIAHLNYLQRDGVTPDGSRGQLYGAVEDQVDGRAFLERSAGDPHQFRFIVAPEDGAELSDLRAFTRDLMTAVEKDLGVPLDWTAVDHFNTAHPHSHVVLRGRDGNGSDLVIAGDYIAHGIRERASELVTLELGPETPLEVRRKLEAEIDQDRFTPIDRALLKDANGGVVDLSQMPHSSDRPLRLSRLKTLERLGLAEQAKPSVWMLKPELEPTLRQLGERGDIVKAINRALAEAQRERPAEALSLHAEAPQAPVIGRVIGKRLTDELGDRLALILDGLDGRVHHLPGGPTHDVEALPRGALVEVRPASDARPADRTTVDFAHDHDGVYRPSQHRQAIEREGRLSGGDVDASVEAHIRRLESLRRARIVERIDADHWRIPEDFEARVAALETRCGRGLSIRILSALDLEAQIGADGATWLDRQLVWQGRLRPAAMGFGLEVENALNARRDRHLAQGDAEALPGGGVRYRAGLLAELERRELDAVGAKLTQTQGLPFRRAQDGEAVQGVFKNAVQLASGKYALVERSLDFTLVPWRPVIEPYRGQRVSGDMQGLSISWRLGRDRGLGL